jgi:phytoene dehydrogenase-like protein
MKKKCVVIGGGLAGMIAARNLARTGGWEVTLLERRGHLGGKADAKKKAPGFIEHGYHVFPAWYTNVRALLNELNIPLVDFDRYHYLAPEGFPNFVTVRGPSGASALLHDTFRNILPWYHTFLYGYSIVDMLSQPLSRKSILDKISQLGMIRDRFYATEALAHLNQENILKASAIPAHDMSAMTAKIVASYWVRHSSPFLSVLKGNLQGHFIDPFAQSVQDANVQIKLNTRVKRLNMNNGVVESVTTRHNGQKAKETGDVFIITTPLEVTRKWITDDVYDADPELGNMHHLEAEPMSALHVFLNYKIPNLPREHVFFTGSHYGLSFIDNAQTWSDPASANGTYLSFISSNFSPLSRVSKGKAKELLLKEIREYMPILPGGIQDIRLNTNIGTPLYINTVGSWTNRPRIDSKIENLFFAGDYVKTDVDLACMEGALASAIQAVHLISENYGPYALPEPSIPTTYPRWLWLLARAGLLPFVLPTHLVARVSEFLGRDEFKHSSVRRQAHPYLDNN